ncbi:MAG: YecH family metal-binding protein [Terrimicrobiaceae bacterium]
MATGQIHGHEIMALVAENPEGIAIATLSEIAAREYGTDAQFYTCSAENMSLPELLTFLSERDKVQLRDDLVLPGGAPACNHD